ncbi:MAG: DUF5916 domain-containing protein [Bacteroidota bacterium]
MRQPLLVMLLACLSSSVFAQSNEPKRTLQAVRVEEAPKIDGKMDDAVWQKAAPATDFVQQRPTPGTKAFQKTEVRVLYDNTALYVGAWNYDVSRDSVSKALSERDNIGATDFFMLVIDAFQGGLDGFEFLVTASGVQFDAKATTNGEDTNWDAVWLSAVEITDEGWFLEYKIPFSALRFPESEVQSWGINFLRSTFRNGERVWWSELKPEVDGFLNQAGVLEGLKDIKPPVRLSFTPFVSYNMSHYPYDQEGVRNFTTQFNAGMDLKYGITDAFTLDMTLVPDFGQVQSDNQVLNLSPFEVFFQERRQFFTEGTELFNKADIFYSRRIGGRPTQFWNVEDQLQEGERIISNPTETRLLNSSKVSGRTNSGLGVGVLNSVTAAMNAEIENEETGEIRTFQTEPFTNYNVLVFDQNLPNNSYVSLVNTSVWRSGSSTVDYDANVTGTEFLFRNKKNTYVIEGQGALSQKYFSDQTDLGYKAAFGIRKTNGKFLIGLDHETINKEYDQNDLGFLRQNNYHSTTLRLNYRRVEPFGKRFLQQFNGVRLEYERLYSPSRFQNLGIVAFTWNQFKNFWSGEVWTYIEPIKTYDFWEPREEGRFYEWPTNYNFGMNFGTDNRKKIRTFFNANTNFYPSDPKRKELNVDVNPSFQVSERFSFRLSTGMYYSFGDIGFATKLNDDQDIIFGRRDRRTVSNTFSGVYNLSPNMWITLRVRHYWSQAEYSEFFLLNEDGTLADHTYTGLDSEGAAQHDQNFNAFNVDMVYRWRFAPGSEISVVWKDAITEFNQNVQNGYFNNFGETLGRNQNNLLSIKVLYFLDYLYLKKKK